MRVAGPPPPSVAGPAAAARRTGGGGAFSVADPVPTEARTGASAASQTSVLTGLDALLTLQGNGDPPAERRRRSIRRGQDLLDGLDRLKAALLGGRVAVNDLQAIAGRLAERSEESGDPRLDGLMAEIELRAAVELAKLDAARRR